MHVVARASARGNGACAKVTFAEQVPGLTTRYGRSQAESSPVKELRGFARGRKDWAVVTAGLTCVPLAARRVARPVSAGHRGLVWRGCPRS